MRETAGSGLPWRLHSDSVAEDNIKRLEKRIAIKRANALEARNSCHIRQDWSHYPT